MHKASIPNTTAPSKLDELRLVTLHMHETGDTRTALAPDLVRKVTEIKVPEGERACFHCGAEMNCIGYALHEWVEYIPAHIEVHVERREKLACKAREQDIVTAPRSDIIRSECRAGFSLLAQLIEAKCDMLRRLGFEVPQNTLYGYWDLSDGAACAARRGDLVEGPRQPRGRGR